MNKKFYISILLIILFSTTLALENRTMSWKFDNYYKKKRIFLHEFVTYDFDSDWTMEWEKNLFKKHGLRLNVGSVSLDNLFNEVLININSELGNNWWFRLFYNRHDSKFKNTFEESNYIGFEKKITLKLYIFSLCNHYYNKEEIDLDLGFMIADQSLEKYCRIALCWDNFVYNKKNKKGGKITKLPLGIRWAVRFGNNKLCFFSEGKYTTGFSVDYPNQKLSPEIYYLDQKIDNITAKLYYTPSEKSLLELKFYYYHFYQQELYYESLNSYSYLNEIFNNTIKFRYFLNEKINIKPEFHFILQNSHAHGYKKYDFTRLEFIPGLFLNYSLSKSEWEIGYMISNFDFNYDDIIAENNYEKNCYEEKVQISWTYNINKNTRLLLSLSHVPSIDGFGGANLHYIMFF
jgi:hypothetical protein